MTLFILLYQSYLVMTLLFHLFIYNKNIIFLIKLIGYVFYKLSCNFFKVQFLNNLIKLIIKFLYKRRWEIAQDVQVRKEEVLSKYHDYNNIHLLKIV
jgi:hypothetical protein